ncbi:MAG: SUMF1/EgtB/PvdO family nonheme iron enzyme [Candidatus Latescibacteria bacterium]|nr:SUMF1/EgtB/PvdO family nonheme iron enzyme [Candidatus Latescibacterota bacterium]
MQENKLAREKTVIRRDFIKGTILGMLGLVLEHTDSAAQAKVSAKEFVTQSGLKMIQTPGGLFTMGDKEGDVDEVPHKVYINSFCIDKYLVTQEEYEKVVGENVARWKGKKNPVEQVRWSDAVNYCNTRSRQEGLQPCYDTETWECNFDVKGYRLPTEAEWEYVCRAGTNTKFYFGDNHSELKSFSWFKENSGGRPRPVGQKLPNPLGIFDLYGNVWEWCNDFYKVDYYQESPEKNPKGPEFGDNKVLRGGSWDSDANQCRSSYRYNEVPGYSDICFGYDIYGFRCAKNL